MSKQSARPLKGDRTLEELKTNTQSGLSSEEASQRLAKYGPNELPKSEPVRPWMILLRQFKGVMNLLLIAAGVIAFVIGEGLDALAIIVVIFVNSVLGFVNEYRAEKAVQALKSLTVPKARVVRDGALTEIPAEKLVPGDLIFLETGDKIPADAKLVESWNLSLDESILTGESVSVDKDTEAVLLKNASLAERMTMVYNGTVAVRGRGKAVVTSTGLQTELGSISSLVKEARKEDTPLQKRLDRLGRYMVVIALAIALVITLLGVARGEKLLPMLETGIAVAVAAVPEGLLAVLTISLALGTKRMAKRNAIIRRLASVETLGTTNLICTDKTGTLTQNQMTVCEVYNNTGTIGVSGAGYAPEGSFYFQGNEIKIQDPQTRLLLLACALCNNSELRDENGWEVVGDPTEGALITLACKGGLDYREERSKFPRVREAPFDSKEGRMASINKSDGSYHYFVKGAPEKVLGICKYTFEDGKTESLTGDDVEDIHSANTRMARKSLRVLAFAYKYSEREDENPYSDLVFLGLVGMMDPPRPGVKDSIRTCQDAGIRVVMITGDHRTTAEAIARDLGIINHVGGEEDVVEGSYLDKLDEGRFRAQVEKTAVYSRVSPEHKLRIVESFEDLGHIVAMTGDGVNDAPALEAADIGVSMGKSGTEVAREASDMILADDNFSTIVAAVEEGRVVFANVRKFIHYLFSCNLSEVAIMLIATISGLPIPLLPLQILWLNLVTDVFPALALAEEGAEPGVMKHVPIKNGRRMPLSFVTSILVQGALLTVAATLAFLWAVSSGDVSRAPTVAFLTLAMSQVFHVFNSRLERGTVVGGRLFSNKAVLGAVALTLALMIIAVYLPPLELVLHTVTPTAQEWGVIFLASISPALIIEAYKALRA